MNTTEVQKPYYQRHDRISDEQLKKNIQTIVAMCLHKKQELFAQQKKIEDTLKIVNIVLEDLKDGRLDRIFEMQVKDPSTKESCGFVIKESLNEEQPATNGKWYKPYFVCFNGESDYLEIHSSGAKDYAVGTYLIGSDKKVIHFRK